MDVRMPRRNGPDAARELMAAHPGVHVVVLTTFDEDEVVDAALHGGAAGLLLTSSPPENMTDAVRRADEVTES